MTAADPPVILLSSALLTLVQGALEAQGWRVVYPETVATADLRLVRAVVHAGPMTLAPEVLAALPKPGLLACLTAGYDGVDVDWFRANDMEVTHAQGSNADDVADLAVGLLLAGWRDIVRGDRAVREGDWSMERRPGDLRPGLAGRKAGIVGLGHIGAAIARRLEPFGIQVAWWGPNPKAAPWPMADSLLQLAADSDILFVACRADETNRGMIDAQVIEAVGPHGMIVNVARGSLIDEGALIAALKSGRLGRAGLDVFQEEPSPADRWAETPGTALTPHTGGATSDGANKLIGQTIENVRRHLAGQPLLSPVAR